MRAAGDDEIPPATEPKDEFVATVSFCNLVGSMPLFAALAWHGFLDGEIVVASGVGAVLAWFGVLLGT